MRSSRREFLQTVAGGAAATVLAPNATPQPIAPATEFVAAWPEDLDRVWVGPEFWANRLQDWRVQGGRLECLQGGAAWPLRTVHLLTRRLGTGPGDLRMSVRTGQIEPRDGPASPQAAAGFLVGAGGAEMEYRAAALIHRTPGPGGGLVAGVDGAGQLFVRDFETTAAPLAQQPMPAAWPAEVLLTLTVTLADGKYTLILTAQDAATGRQLGQLIHAGVEPRRLVGNLGLVSHPGAGPRAARFGFRDWRLSGSKVEVHPDRTCGPILCTQYTVHQGTLKVAAQLLPVGPKEPQTADLQIRQGANWQTVATARLVVPGYTATFRVGSWDTTRDIAYRVAYGAATWSGTIKRDPVDKPAVVLAALSCVQQIDGNLAAGAAKPGGGTYAWNRRVWFPHHDLVPNVAKQRPDLLFFAGDQIYEGNPTPPIRQPALQSQLDYLYKWYLWCWSYRDLTRDIPCVTIPDDHDVYHPNIWGAGGRAAAEGDPTGLRGGYGMPPEWINMIQRTQCSHLPDPYDPAPAEQGVSVYYTSLTWGGIGFAILEDRKFKSPPTLIGNVRMTPDSHILDPNYDTRKADVVGAQLLGERQERFLGAFAQDWRGQVMKAALSQTIFCNLQISSRGETTGQLDKDLDSNGWPQSGRNRALRELRRGLMVHIAGDQHLASVVRHGIDDFDDAVWSLCVPAASNLYTRFWNPSYRPRNYQDGMRPFLGQYEDGFHNQLTVHAVANPVEKPRPGQFPEPVELYRKGTGYGIVRFDKATRTIAFEVWPRYVGPTDPKTGSQYPGWPITVAQADNDGRRPVAWLPTLQVTGMSDPVVQVEEEAGGEVLYALRIKGTEYRPKVFREGTYTVRVGEPGTARWQTLTKLAAGRGGNLRVNF